MSSKMLDLASGPSRMRRAAPASYIRERGGGDAGLLPSGSSSGRTKKVMNAAAARGGDANSCKHASKYHVCLATASADSAPAFSAARAVFCLRMASCSQFRRASLLLGSATDMTRRYTSRSYSAWPSGSGVCGVQGPG